MSSYGFVSRSLVTLGFTMPFFAVSSCGFSTGSFFTVSCGFSTGSFFTARRGFFFTVPPSVSSGADADTSCCLFLLLKLLVSPRLPVALAAFPLLRGWWILACFHQPRPQFFCHRLRITFGGPVFHQPRNSQGREPLPIAFHGSAILDAIGM